MEAGDGTIEGSVSSLMVNSLESNGREEVLSPEDLAWVDSCLINDSNVTDSNWDSLKDALLEILIPLPKSSDSAGESNGFPGGTDVEGLRSSEVAPAESHASASVSNDFSLGTDMEDCHADEEAETEETDRKMSDDDISSKPKTPNDFDEPPVENINFSGNPFRPDFKDDIQEKVVVDLGLDFGFSAYEIEPSNTDIFRVWDLEIPEEEDEFSIQLNKVLDGSPDDSKSKAVFDLTDESLDSLIAGINDLSLNHHI